MLEVNKVYNESCITGMQKMNEGCVDLVVTSPPYDNLRTYNDSSSWSWDVFTQVAQELTRVLKPGGVIMWNVGDAVIKGSETGTSFRQALYFKDECGLWLHDTMLYQKPSAAYPAGKNSNRYSQVFEYCFILTKGKLNTSNLLKDKKNTWAGVQNFGKVTSRQKDGTMKEEEGRITVQEFGYRDNIWRIPNGKGFGQANAEVYKHPATMPEALAHGHILTWSNPGDLVLDPFMGSGTTARMSFKEDRNWIGFEIDKEYFDLCVRCTEFNSVFDK